MLLHQQWRSNKVVSDQYVTSSYTNYIQSIKNNISLNIDSWNFKSDHSYMSIVTNVTKNVGVRYLNEILLRFNEVFTQNKNFIIDICNKNDTIGKPLKHTFNNFTTCEPSDLRYILHSFLILEYMKKNNMNDIDIIEIGGGYGGLCYFLNNLSSLFDITIKSYTILDLLLASQLQQKYLDNFNIKNVKCYQLDNLNNLNKNSFLISNYAFSEISIDIQKQYIKNVINPYVNNGFVLWNHMPLYQFINKKLNVEIAKRVPLEKIIKETEMPSLTDFIFSKDNDYVEEVCVYF